MAPLARLAGHADSASHKFDQLLGYCEADARAFYTRMLISQSNKRLKQLVLVLSGYSKTGIYNIDLNAFSV